MHALKLGSDHAPVGLWVGALEDYSLLSGHLVQRYSNRAHPDDHPAGGYLMSTMGPLCVEAFTSDVLGARLVGAPGAWGAVVDLGADVLTPTLDMKLRLEARRQRGGFR